MSALVLHEVGAMRGARPVLDRVSVTFAAGQLTAVIGPNGAGKSTLLGVAAGLIRPCAGEVHLGGQALASLPARDLARRRAYLPQRAGVEWPIPVARVVALGLTPTLPVFGRLSPALERAVDAALEACDVLHLRDRPVTEVSGGELARIMLARAIVGDPEVLIVDEPTGGLDPRHAIDALRRLHQRARQGCTVIMAIHDLDCALNHADALVALSGGRVMAQGPVATMADPAMLGALYEVPVRLTQDSHGHMVRFLAPD